MKLLKTVVNFTVPLAAMLIIFSTYLIVNKVVSNYKDGIADDYTIIITAKKPMEKMGSIAGEIVKELLLIDQKTIIDDIKDTVSSSTIKLLNQNMPLFYKIHLEEFPSKENLARIKKELDSNPNIMSVEMFADDHKHIYSFLIMIQNLSFILFSVVLAFAILLVVRQIKIWFFEHSRRIRIMELHGGSILYSSRPILSVVAISSIFSLLLTIVILFFALNNFDLFVQQEILEFMPNLDQLKTELLMIVLLSFAIPIVTYLGLLIKYKLK